MIEQTVYLPARTATRYCRVTVLSFLIVGLLSLAIGAQAGIRISRETVTDNGGSSVYYLAPIKAVLHAADHRIDPVSHDVPSGGLADTITIPCRDYCGIAA